MSGEGFLRSKTRRAAGSLQRLEAEPSERPLRGGLPVLCWCLSRASLSLDSVGEEPDH